MYYDAPGLNDGELRRFVEQVRLHQRPGIHRLLSYAACLCAVKWNPDLRLAVLPSGKRWDIAVEDIGI
jgi:hypothetical protein